MISWWLGTIILTVIFLIICILIGCKTTHDEGAGYLFIILFFALICSDIFCGMHSFFSPKDINIKYTYNEKVYVHSIEDNFKTTGIFVLGSGGIGSDLYYYAMIGDNKEGYTVIKFKAEDTYLIPEENTEPYYIEKHKTFDTVYAHNYIFGGLFKEMQPELNQDEIVKRELHLPKNYIKQNYNIDMK